MSRKAILGLVWFALCVLPGLVGMVVLFLETDGRSVDPPLVWGSLVFGGVLSWIGVAAVNDIRESAGRVHGLGLALFEALLVPLVVLDGILAAVTVLGPNWLLRDVLRERGDVPLWMTALLATGVVLVVDWLIVRHAWRWANGPALAVPFKGTANAERRGLLPWLAGVAVVVAGFLALASIGYLQQIREAEARDAIRRELRGREVEPQDALPELRVPDPEERPERFISGDAHGGVRSYTGPTFTGDEPVRLTAPAKAALALTDEQTGTIEAALTDAKWKWVRAITDGTRVELEGGTFTAKFPDLIPAARDWEREVWAKVDPVLNTEQEESLRRNLDFSPGGIEEFLAAPPSEPVLFPVGTAIGGLGIEREGEWFGYSVDLNPRWETRPGDELGRSGPPKPGLPPGLRPWREVMERVERGEPAWPENTDAPMND